MKILFKSLAVILLLVLLAIVALVFLVDANRFKPRIEAIAKEHGVALQINGDLGWNFWPSLGVAVNDVRVAAVETPTDPIAELLQASLMLKLIPLFSGDFQVDHIAVDGLHLKLARDSAGKANWEVFSNTETDTPQTTNDAGSELTLDIQQLSLANTRVDYKDAQSGQSLSLTDLDLTLAGVNTRNEPFAVDASFSVDQVQPDGKKLGVVGKLATKASIDNSLNNLGITDGQLELEISGKEKATLALNYALSVKELQKELSYQGQITLKETNARKLLAVIGTELDTAKPDALGKVGLAGSFTGDLNKVKLDNLELLLDETAFKGTAGVTNFESPTIKVSLTGETLNADDYLPPPNEKTSDPNVPVDVPQSVAQTEDTPLPLEMLRSLNLNIKLALQKLIVNQIALQNLELKVLAKNGMIESNIDALAYSGKISAKSQLDARGQLAQLQFDAGVESLELEPLLKDMEMDSKFGLQGAIQARALGTSQGNSTGTLFKALRANANFSGAQVRVSPINLEEQFCKLVNLVNQAEDPAKAWDAYTEMSELSGSVKLRDQIVTIDTFKAGVEKLQLSSSGKINLATDQYDIFLPFKLIKDKTDTVTADNVAVTTSANGCSVGSFYWIERGLELLRCKGSFAEINPLSDCRPDKELLVELTKDYAAYKIKEKHGAKIEEKKQEVKTKLEEKKQQLFDKLQQRLNKGATSSVTQSETSSVSSVAP
ncbi:MAG TPA: AsmA family protein [Cellvibrio sp.]|nr:AsmA family protein [Cellvibrio sp.]